MVKNNIFFQTKICQKVPGRFKKQVDDLLEKCFGQDKGDTPQSKAEHHDRFCSGHNQIKQVLAIENNEVIGTILILKRKISFKNKPVILGGLGGVCTREDKRKRGVATHLLKIAVKELRRSGSQIAYLCTDLEKNGPLYGQYGFEALGRKHTYLGKSGKRYFDDDAMIAPIGSKTLFKAVMADDWPLDIGTGNW